MALLASAALAAPPGVVMVEGGLQSAAGPAADGDYDLTFRLWDDAKAGTELWSEGKVSVAVSGGRFSVALGQTKPIAPATLAGGKVYLGLAVGADPELSRQPLRSVPFALAAAAVDCDGCVGGDQLASGGVAAAKVAFNYAGSATKGGPALDVACTACVSVAELKFDGDVDLGGNSLKGANATFSGDVSAKTVTATSFVGDGSKLSGIKAPAGTCDKAGEVVKGIASDGSLICVAALDPKALPADGLDEISGGLLSNQFVDTITAPNADVAIPDNTGAVATSDIVVPDLGTAQSLSVTVHVTNTDLASLALVLLPPGDKKTGITLCDPCGNKDEKLHKATYPAPSKPASGDLGAFIGTNVKGTWNLRALDSSFCIVQAPGNAALCNPADKTDGAIVSWSIGVGTHSATKVGVLGDLQLSATKTPCDTFAKGALHWNESLALVEQCDGAAWVPLAPAKLGSRARPAASCAAILAGGGSEGDGVYWLAPVDKQPPYEAYCDMTTDGGGWTLVASIIGGDYKASGDSWEQKWQQGGYNRWADTSTFGAIETATLYARGDYKSRAYFELSAKDMLFYHVPSGTAVGEWRDASVYTYHSSNGFLAAKGGNLQQLFAKHCVLTNGGGTHQCLHVPITYDVGSEGAFAAEQCPNNRGESQRGFVTFGAWNGEGSPHAFCPVKQNGHNAEHSCLGGNGSTCGQGCGGWGNLREWYYDGNWCMSVKLRTAAVMMLVR